MWERKIVHQGLPFYVSTALWDERGVVCVPVQREEFIGAIRSKDPRIFDFLNLMVDDIEEIHAVMCMSEGGGGNQFCTENPFDYDEWLRVLGSFCNS